MISLMPNSSIILTFRVLLKTLVYLCYLPNDVHEARKWSYRTALQLSLRVYNMDIWPGLIVKVLSMLLFYLAHTSFSVCPFLLPLAPMYPWEQLPAWVNYQQLTMFEQNWFWSTSLWETYINLCHFFTNESGDSILDCIHLFWNEVAPARLTSFVGSYWLSWPCLAVLHELLNFRSDTFCIFTVFDYYLYGIRTILILHSLTQCYAISCFFVSFSKQLSHTNSLYIAVYVHLLCAWLFCKESSHIDFFLYEHYSFFSHRVTHSNICCGFTRTKFMVLLSLCGLLIFESYI
jgi:hypothetical protein